MASSDGVKEKLREAVCVLFLESRIDSCGVSSSRELIVTTSLGDDVIALAFGISVSSSSSIYCEATGHSSCNIFTNSVRPAVGHRKQDLDMSMQDLASRAASRVMATTVKNISAPKSAYEFEVSWRALSGDSIKQASLLKTILPATLPQIFKNALSAPMLIEIIKCTATFFKEDTKFAVSILDNLTKIPRFDMIVMCFSAVDHAEIHRLWEEVFSMRGLQADLVETLSRLRPRFCYGEWQAHIVGSSEWPPKEM